MTWEYFQQKPRVCTVLGQSCYITATVWLWFLSLYLQEGFYFFWCFDTFSKSPESTLFWSELLYHCLGIDYPIPTTNIVKKPQFQDFLWLRKFLPLFAPLTVNSPLAKRNRNPLQSYSKGSEVGRSPQMKVPWNKQQAEESAASKCCECDSPNTADNTPYLRSL